MQCPWPQFQRTACPFYRVPDDGCCHTIATTATGFIYDKAAIFRNAIKETLYVTRMLLCTVQMQNGKMPLSHDSPWSLYVPSSGHCMYRQFNIQQFCVLPTQCICVFCVDLRTNSDYFTVQHWLVGFCNWDGVCLLRGTFYILRSAHTVYLCVLCGSENKQRLFHCTALTGWFL